MARLLILFSLVLMVLALVGVILTTFAQLAREGRAVARGMALDTRREGLQKVGYVALILVMLGVTSGLLGGL